MKSVRQRRKTALVFRMCPGPNLEYEGTSERLDGALEEPVCPWKAGQVLMEA